MPRQYSIPLSEINKLKRIKIEPEFEEPDFPPKEIWIFPPPKRIKIEPKIEEPDNYIPKSIKFRALPSKWEERPYKAKPRLIGPTEYKHYLYNIAEELRPPIRNFYAKRDIVDVHYNVIALKSGYPHKVLKGIKYIPPEPTYITPEEYQEAFTVLPAETAQPTISDFVDVQDF